MKILYAVQATGNGHISRAQELMPYLQRHGDVDVFLSGDNCTLKSSMPIKYRSKGISLYYKSCGGLDFFKTVKRVSYLRAIRDARDLPVEKYDLVINDFEHITSLACKQKGVRSVHLGHQASFTSVRVPRPEKRSWLGETILSRYCRADVNIGFHFDRYDDHIFYPVIKRDILLADPKDLGHISIYLPSIDRHCIEDALLSIKNVNFHWFLPNIKKPFTKANLSYFPIDNASFTTSLINCHGLITGGGFETPAEALYLRKKLLSIPIPNHYEQQCNAAALKEKEVSVIHDFSIQKAKTIIEQWLDEKKPNINMPSNDVAHTVEFVVHKNESPVFTKPEPAIHRVRYMVN